MPRRNQRIAAVVSLAAVHQKGPGIREELSDASCDPLSRNFHQSFRSISPRECGLLGFFHLLAC
jgi:hypothetical protein